MDSRAPLPSIGRGDCVVRLTGLEPQPSWRSICLSHAQAPLWTGRLQPAAAVRAQGGDRGRDAAQVLDHLRLATAGDAARAGLALQRLRGRRARRGRLRRPRGERRHRHVRSRGRTLHPPALASPSTLQPSSPSPTLQPPASSHRSSTSSRVSTLTSSLTRLSSHLSTSQPTDHVGQAARRPQPSACAPPQAPHPQAGGSTSTCAA